MRFGDYMHALWHLAHPDQSCEPPQEMVITDVSLQRQMLYDAFNDAEGVARIVGLSAVSEEVAEMEQRAHVERLGALAPVMPLLIEQANFLGHAAAVIQCINTDTDLQDEQATAVLTVFTDVIKASLVSAVSTAVGLGVLEVSRGVTVNE